ncbi:helix-turn-helix domain-containing protein [Actinomadura parmotrematis]|uniref:Helix-turn-helix domain-containing protein n=1 Tax=Actinomadura parmotrematis TaxID=2864039 RepID=A0ABS7G4Z5_9ACTN|nr:helix-turn-helix domain-containing protein [Actinomadura parmotrematis]MBW8486698.1 helix-turn-helix domain-containing protein [Actinomadura parmotrematis]
MTAELWTIDDLARFLRKKKSWVYENYREQFPYYKVGQQIRFDPAEIRAALREHRDNGAGGI